MTQPPSGPYRSGDDRDDRDDSGWARGPGQGANQPDRGDQPPSEPTWGGQAGPEPTWGPAPGAGSDRGQDPPPRYEPAAEYRPGPYGPPPQGPRPPSKAPWIAGIAAAAVVVVVLAVVLFTTLGGDDDNDPIVDPGPLTTTSSQSSATAAEEQIEESIRTYTTAFTDGDWNTALSVTCGAEQDIIRDLQSDTGVELNGMKLNSVTAIEVDGDTAQATVSLTYVDPADQSPVETSRFAFTMENRTGTWKICNTREI